MNFITLVPSPDFLTQGRVRVDFRCRVQAIFKGRIRFVLNVGFSLGRDLDPSQIQPDAHLGTQQKNLLWNKTH